MVETVPIIDLSLPESEAAELCRQACETHGFFIISNHEIPDDIIDQHMLIQEQFFNLPLDLKLTVVADENNRGYTPVGEETLDPENSTSGDNKEGIYFGREVPSESPESRLPLHGPNQWISETILPGYRAIVEEYMKAVTNLALFKLLPIISLSLGLDRNYLDCYFKQPMTFLRPLHYIAQKSNEKSGQFAAGAHRDYGCLTLLHAPSPGLQIFTKTNTWVDITPIPGCFIVNLGDMLERWTGGKFTSTLHRVVNPEGKERFSCAFFFEPDFTTVVDVLPTCREENGGIDVPPPITSGQYLLEKYAQTYQKKKMG